ncbi:hypothetical protein [Luteolibacter sp. Populi]|uniref:hypothetical protein n=1 Tax=Luteolibacter sp. Populi TaxID=3230487 RepID=UPI0034659065
MQTSSKLRALAFIIAAVALVSIAFLFLSGPRSTPPPAAASEPHTAPAAPRPATHGNPLTAADWMEKIRQVPAAARPALMREVLAIADAGLRDEIATALAMAWMEDDLDNYLAFVDAQLVSEGLTSESTKRFSVALMRSFETAAGKTELKGKLRYVAEAIVTYLMATHPDGAEAWAREYLVSLDLDMALARIAPAMASTAPAKAIEIFSGIKSVAPRLSAASTMGAALVKHDPAAAMTWANSIHAHTERTLAMGGVVTAISDADPTRAAALLKAFLEKIQNEYTSLREKDRQQAGVKPEDEFETRELYEEYLETNGYALMQPDTPEADYLLKAGEQIGFDLAKTDPLGAIAWAKSLAVGILQAHAISGALSGWSTWAPQEAVNYYVQNYGYNPVTPTYLFENWANQDLETAVAAVKNLPEAGQQSAAIQGVTTSWLDSGEDLPGLIEWVGQLPPGKDRDTARLAIIEQTGDSDPAGAWLLVTQVTDPTARKLAAQEVFSVLAVDRPAAARQMLADYTAPAPELQALARILAMAQESP